jgi:hypothetical protein
MRIVFAFLCLLVISSNCQKREVTEDVSLFGNWNDDLVKYTFQSDLRFGKKALVDDPLDTLNLDSSWGTFEVYNNEILVFNFEGYLLENGFQEDTAYLGPTWNYVIEGNIMRYTSSTIVGSLTKQP